jgi:LPS-assembly protein
VRETAKPDAATARAERAYLARCRYRFRLACLTFALAFVLIGGRLVTLGFAGTEPPTGSLRDIFPEGTGLTGRVSDIVGRTRVRYGRFIDITHRYRIDRKNFAVRRNEIDLTVGTAQSYVQFGYLRLNRNIDPSIEDLRDKEELRVAARILIQRYWSIFGASVIDLTDRREDPLSVANGWQPVRNRVGIQYEDDCLELGVTWRRDYERIGTFRKGSTFAIHLALKGISR